MKRSKKLLALLIGLIIVCAAAIAAVRLTRKPDSQLKGEMIVFDAPEDAFVKLTIKLDGESMVFLKERENWIYEGDSDMVLTQLHFEKMIRELSPLKATGFIGQQKDLSAYGLAQPRVSFTAETEDQAITIMVGNESALGNDRYFMVDDGIVYTGSKDLYSDFDNSLLEYMAPEAIPDMSRSCALEIYRTDETIELAMETRDEKDTWYLIEEGKGIELDREETQAFVDIITGLAWKKSVGWKPSAADLMAFGLGTDAPMVTVSYLDDTRSVCQFSFCVGADAEGNFQAQVQGSPQVHRIDDRIGNAIQKATFRSGIKMD